MGGKFEIEFRVGFIRIWCLVRRRIRIVLAIFWEWVKGEGGRCGKVFLEERFFWVVVGGVGYVRGLFLGFVFWFT